jgi:hypothetical protein
MTAEERATEIIDTVDEALMASGGKLKQVNVQVVED